MDTCAGSNTIRFASGIERYNIHFNPMPLSFPLKSLMMGGNCPCVAGSDDEDIKYTPV